MPNTKRREVSGQHRVIDNNALSMHRVLRYIAYWTGNMGIRIMEWIDLGDVRLTNFDRYEPLWHATHVDRVVPWQTYIEEIIEKSICSNNTNIADPNACSTILFGQSFWFWDP